MGRMEQMFDPSVTSDDIKTWKSRLKLTPPSDPGPDRTATDAALPAPSDPVAPRPTRPKRVRRKKPD